MRRSVQQANLHVQRCGFDGLVGTVRPGRPPHGSFHRVQARTDMRIVLENMSETGERSDTQAVV